MRRDAGHRLHVRAGLTLQQCRLNPVSRWYVHPVMTTMKRLVRCTRPLLVLLLFGAAATACGPDTAKTTTPSDAANAPASCSVDECAAIPEPPIAPTACGAGHENEIGTTCERAQSGECHKVLTCGGKAPQ
jgi:hypothetical protein